MGPLVVKVKVFKNNYHEVLRDHPYDCTLRVEDRVRVMVSFSQYFHNVLDTIYRLHCCEFARHNSMSLDLLARGRNFIDEDWHLLASA